MRSTLLRCTTLTALALAAALPVSAQGNWRPGDFGSVRFRLGLFSPDGDSTYWRDKFRDFTGSASDFEDTSFGFDYRWPATPTLSLLFGGSVYQGKATQAYRDWVDADGYDIRHVTTLDVNDLTAILVWQPFERAPVSPYVGAGGGFVWWRLSEHGDFIDFAEPDYPIVTTGYRSDGTTWETVLLAGVEVPLSWRWSFFAEGRWRDADDELSDSLAGLGTLDLSGVEYSGGFAYRF